MTSTLPLNTPISNIEFNATNGLKSDLAQHQGKLLVLYFYPKDNTPGCTNESKQFRDLYPQFKAADTEIFGVSRDTLASHEKFKAKFQLPFELIADTDETLCKLFQVIRPKVMFGKSIFGIVRSTFLIGKDGKLLKEWRKVKVKDHASEVLEFINSLKA